MQRSDPQRKEDLENDTQKRKGEVLVIKQQIGRNIHTRLALAPPLPPATSLASLVSHFTFLISLPCPCTHGCPPSWRTRAPGSPGPRGPTLSPWSFSLAVLADSEPPLPSTAKLPEAVCTCCLCLLPTHPSVCSAPENHSHQLTEQLAPCGQMQRLMLAPPHLPRSSHAHQSLLPAGLSYSCSALSGSGLLPLSCKPPHPGHWCSSGFHCQPSSLSILHPSPTKKNTFLYNHPVVMPITGSDSGPFRICR